MTVFETHRTPVHHGTEAGPAGHRRRGELPCEACKAAHSAYMRRWRNGEITERLRPLSWPEGAVGRVAG